MSSRKEQREQARAERQANEQAQAAQAARKRRLVQLGAVAGVVLVAIAIVIAISQSGGDSGNGGGGTTSATETQRLFAGIPQKGEALGNAGAAVTMQEFADLQCPFCREYTLNVLPTLVKNYVRTGKVRLVFRPVVFLGEDSEPAARAALAAGRQNLLWQYVDLFYRNQGEENSGYVTDAFLRKIGEGVKGLDVEKMMADMNSSAVTAQLTEAQSLSDRLKVEGTPSFFLNRTGQAPTEVPVSQLTPDEFTSAIDQALGS